MDPREQTSVFASLERSALYRNYQQAFENTLGLPLELVRPDTIDFPLATSCRRNRFCSLMAAYNSSCAACLKLQQRLIETSSGEVKTAECIAGLTESAIPVRVGERLAGFLRTGQVFLRPPSRARFLAVLRETGIARDSAEAAHLEVAYFRSVSLDRAQYAAALSLLVIFAHHLGTLANRLLLERENPDHPALAKARAFIARNFTQPLRLRDIARAVSVSPDYFCKLFSRATGVTFTQYVARMRAEVAKHHLLNPNTRIREAAFAAGFQSLTQFNRAFRRVAGESPTAFRRRLQLEPQAGNRTRTT